MIYALFFDAHKALISKATGSSSSREDMLARFNDYCSDFTDDSGEAAFFGLTEGVLLSEEAHERGYETEGWVLDEGITPSERDWLSHEGVLSMQAYFKDEKSALAAKSWLTREYQLSPEPRVEAQEEQDWNATWKASFTGIDVDENLKVLPPWNEEWLEREKRGDTQGIVVINPGAGFGTGTHETTQLCMRLLKGFGSLKGKCVLDFGSGSGILGIYAALLGARVYCVEIDPLANENAFENARLNQVQDRIQFFEAIPTELRGGKVDVLLANILRPILIRFAPEIKDCLSPGAELVLSGLIETDLPQVISTYQAGGTPFQITEFAKNEWRALRLKRS